MDNDNNSEKVPDWFLLIIIIALIFWSYLSNAFAKEKKTKELASLKNKIEENIELDNALKIKMRRIFFSIRLIVITCYFSANIFPYFKICGFLVINNQVISDFLNYNSIFFILVSALTFVMFGSFTSYNNWWGSLETKIEVLIYRKSPDLKKMINDDLLYKDQLEMEIKNLNL